MCRFQLGRTKAKQPKKEEGNDNDEDDEDDDEGEEALVESEDPVSPTTASTLTSPKTSDELSSDYQTVMRLLEEGEKITHMYR